MKELNIMEATVFTSPNPLTLICSQNKDGTTNLAPICFVTYLSFNPPMIAFAAGRQSHTGKRVRETGKVIVTVPGESLARAVMACGSTTGATANKVAENHIEMTAVEGSDMQIPALPWWPRCSSLWKWAITSCTSARWTSSWGMRTRKGFAPGTASAKLPPLWKAED